MPRLPAHEKRLEDFQTEYWDFYKELLAYQKAPTAAEAVRLEADFDTLFATVSGYDALDDRIQKTRAHKEELLMVLSHPEIPLHNSAAELAARRRVRKRDVSFGPRSELGKTCWDTCMTLSATTAKLGVNFYHYIKDRLSKVGEIPPWLLSSKSVRSNSTLARPGKRPDHVPRLIGLIPKIECLPGSSEANGYKRQRRQVRECRKGV